MYKLSYLTIIIWITFSGSLAYAQGEGESTSGTLLMVIAYGVLWLLISLYLAIIFKRQRKTEKEISSLKRKIDEALGLEGDN